ncbi:MAG: hypothetical protein HY675_14155 [Chloroflexi bacterium]|nr:hypothetical protein [Chloroflexota bacterium]
MKSHVKGAVTIVIAERLSIVRAGLAALLANEPGFVIVGQAVGGKDT